MITVNVHLDPSFKPEITENIFSGWGTVKITFATHSVELFIHDLGQLRRLTDLLKEIAGQPPTLILPPIEPGVTRAEVEAIQIPPDEDLPF